MKLTILERIMLLNILPSEGNIVTMKIVRDLKTDVGFSEEELEDHKINIDADNITWDPDSSEYIKDISIGNKAIKVIVETLEKLNNDKQLIENIITLYDKFMEDKEEE